MMRVFNFSGGKTSAYMTIKFYQDGDLVIFCDTGREHSLTYKFIDDFEKHENINVIRLKYQNADKPFNALIEKKKSIPNFFKRFCTNELKINTQKRYLKSIGIRKFENFIGFRYDEQIRIKNRKQKFVNVIDKFPLNENKIDKQMINKFWKSKLYNLEIPAILGNCTLCFMKGKNAIINILSTYPDLADEWIADEIKSNYTYFNGITIKQLKDIAQNNLFKNNLDQILPAYNCACTT
jgi:hypothetical protein